MFPNIKRTSQWSTEDFESKKFGALWGPHFQSFRVFDCTRLGCHSRHSLSHMLHGAGIFTYMTGWFGRGFHVAVHIAASFASWARPLWGRLSDPRALWVVSPAVPRRQIQSNQAPEDSIFCWTLVAKHGGGGVWWWLGFQKLRNIYEYIYIYTYVYIRADGYYNIHSTRAILTYPVKYRMLLKPMFFMNCCFFWSS